MKGLINTSFVLFAAAVFFAVTASGQRHNSERIGAAVFQAAGPNAGSIQGAVDQFRAAIGGVNNGNGPAQTSGRREINWDGGGSTATSPGSTPFDVFLNTRGGRFVTPGSGFVQFLRLIANSQQSGRSPASSAFKNRSRIAGEA